MREFDWLLLTSMARRLPYLLLSGAPGLRVLTANSCCEMDPFEKDTGQKKRDAGAWTRVLAPGVSRIDRPEGVLIRDRS